MRFTSSYPALIVAACLSLPVFGTVVETDKLLEELNKLEQLNESGTEATKRQIIAILEPGLASGPAAVRIYEQAILATRFNGLKDDSSAILEWRKKNAEKLRSPEMTSAALLHLKYLVLSLNQGNDAMENTKIDFVGLFWSYAIELETLLEKKMNDPSFPKEAAELLDKSLRDSPYVQWLEAGRFLPSGGEWAPSAGDFSGILEKNIRSRLLKQKSPKAIDVWDSQIAFETKAVMAKKLDLGIQNFNQKQLPNMLFKRSMDLIEIGQKERGIRDAIAVARQHYQHPDFKAWVGKIREKINDGKMEIPPSSEAPE